MKLTENILQVLKDKKISIEDLNDRYFGKSYDEAEIENILKLLNNTICSFRELVEKFKSTGILHNLLQSKELFEEVIQNNKLNKDDLRYLLNRIDNIDELDKLCWNTSLIKYILNDFIFDKKDIDKFNTLIENDDWWCKKENIHTLFDYIKRYNKNNEELLKLIELTRKIYLLTNFDLNEEQKVELIEILRSNEIARNRLIQLIDNNLEDQYDFEQLKNLLTKDNDKNLKTKFNF